MRLDRFGVAQYVCRHGVCFPNVCCLGRESHNLWLGTVCAAQPTFNSESRHLIHFHRQPYCLGGSERMTQDSQTISAWSDYRSRRRWFFGVWLGGLPSVILLAGALITFFHSELPFYFVGGAWLVSFAVAGFRLTLFRCPSCHHHFFCTWYFSNHFARRCVHCGLPKWTEID